MVWATSALPRNERFTGVGGGREAMANDAHGVRPMVTGSPFFSTFFLSPISVSFAKKVNPRWLQLMVPRLVY